MPRSASALPFDDIRALVAEMPSADPAAGEAIRARDRQLTKPAGSLGRIEAIVEWLGAWQGREVP
ncbi:MAG: nicotinate-nucleotide--dimethylbenzimidazole phosphoribosyltransferase, partial [Rhizobiales bacterium]|nr:nicotinate-nucleotide--dimethylbenzimidazole phosphoribosyltransferase [Hyphomicrobiales bacterium]